MKYSVSLVQNGVKAQRYG